MNLHGQHRRAQKQLRAFVLDLKQALRELHQGPEAVPRKQVFLALGVSEALYSRWLNSDEPDIPGLVDLVAIVGITQNPAPLRAVAAWSGEGWDLVPLGGEGAGLEVQEAHRLLGHMVEADAKLTAGLARDLVDGRLDRSEALARLPEAEERLRQATTTVDTLKRAAQGPVQ